MRAMTRSFTLAMTLVAAAASLPAAEERPDLDVAWKIRREATEHSQIMKTLHVLTDVYGPRLTGSPNLKQAGEWVAHQLEQWGLANAHLEPWNRSEERRVGKCCRSHGRQ